VKFPFNLPTSRPFDVAGFGLNAVDHIVVVPEYPAFDTKTRLSEHIQSAGGQTASAIVGLRRLGMRAVYAGRFGSDPEGAFGLRTLEDEGVDVSLCERVEGSRTQIAFILVDAQSGERTILWDRDDRLGYSADEAPIDLAAVGRVLHIDAHDPAACLRMATAARASGTIVSGDFDNVYPGLPDLLPHVDVLISSKEFPRKLMGITDNREALIELKSRYGFPIVGMTLGEQGSLIYAGGTFMESQAFAVPGGCKDTTGSGDAYHAGFLYGLLTGEDIETSAMLGNAVAALNCRALGARTALPTLDELSKLLAAPERLLN
jgi:sulfofructose kinase